MAHFYASIQGARGETTRTGTKASGIEGHIRGWDSGVFVQSLNTGPTKDEFAVWATSGSNDAHTSRYLGVVKLVDSRPVFVPADAALYGDKGE